MVTFIVLVTEFSYYWDDDNFKVEVHEPISVEEFQNMTEEEQKTFMDLQKENLIRYLPEFLNLYQLI